MQAKPMRQISASMMCYRLDRVGDEIEFEVEVFGDLYPPELRSGLGREIQDVFAIWNKAPFELSEAEELRAWKALDKENPE